MERTLTTSTVSNRIVSRTPRPGDDDESSSSPAKKSYLASSIGEILQRPSKFMSSILNDVSQQSASGEKELQGGEDYSARGAQQETGEHTFADELYLSDMLLQVVLNRRHLDRSGASSSGSTPRELSSPESLQSASNYTSTTGTRTRSGSTTHNNRTTS
ncbi:unnamed protein product, partial [Amoebophrya sp. A25]|eukprot:GSA25T00022399001.1